MALISEKDRAAIEQLFDENLVNEVRLMLFTIPTSALIVPGRQTCETCNDVQQLVEELTAMSDKLTLEVHHFEREPDIAKQYGVTRVPALVLATSDEARVRYFGIPGGYEFMTLLQDIQSVSKRESVLSPETRIALSAYTEPIHLQVFVTPSCPHCPRVAGLAHQMAIEFANITADVIEANEFEELSRRYAVTGVPKTVINDRIEFVGAVPEESFVAAIKQAMSPEPSGQPAS